MQEVKEGLKLHNLRIDYVMIQSKLKYSIGAKGAGTVYLEPRSSSNQAKYLRFYVRSGYQTCQAKAGRVFPQVWNRTEPNHRSKPGLLAGYPDPLITLMNTLTIGKRGRLYQAHLLNVRHTDMWLSIEGLNHSLKKVSRDYKEITLSWQ